MPSAADYVNISNSVYNTNGSITLPSGYSLVTDNNGSAVTLNQNGVAHTNQLSTLAPAAIKT